MPVARNRSRTLAYCRNTQRISAWHDGELPPPEAQELAQHVAECPACRHELDSLGGLSRWLSSAPIPEIPAAALSRLRYGFRPQRDRAILRTARALTAVAAAVLIACSVLLWRGMDAGVAPDQTPGEWERAAIMPTLPEPRAEDEDVEVELARSILGSFSGEGGRGYE